MDSGPLSFLTVSNKEVGGEGQGKNPTLIPQSLLYPELAERQSQHDRFKRSLLGGAIFNRISGDLENEARKQWIKI